MGQNADKIIVAIVLTVVGIILYLCLNVVIRRLVAIVRSQEEYDEDVDGKMTKAEKQAFEESKIVEQGKRGIGFKDVYAEYKGRFIVTAVLGGVLGGLVGYTFGASFDAAILFIFFAVLTVIAFVDMDTMEIPPVLNLIILVLGIISLIGSFVSDSGQMLFEITWQQRLIGFFSVSVFMLVVTVLVAGAFGGGDIKLMAAAGLLLGWRGTLIAFLIGLIVGAVIGIILMSRKKKGGKEHMPFGPSLCIGLVMATLVGNQLIDWYMNIIRNAMPNTFGK